MKLENFEEYILKFINEDKYNNEYKRAYTNSVEAFQNDYNANVLKNLTAEQMVYGNKDKGLYHRLKEETKVIGSIDVRSSNYGVFKKDGKIYPNPKFGNTIEKAAQNFRDNMFDILDSSLDCDESRIIENPLPKTLKYKLASIYNSAYFLPIYSVHHVNFFLECLGYSALGKNQKDYFKGVHLLLDEKNSNSITKNWSNHKYARVLYYMFDSPKKNGKQGEVFKTNEGLAIISTDKYMGKEIIHVESHLVDAEERVFKFNPNTRGKTKDFEKEQRKNIINGDIAEEKVIEFEKQRLLKLDRNYDVSKIEKVSEKNYSAGFDIKSFNENGSERYIEVKSTVTNNLSFNLSINEFLAGKYYKENYWVYFVCLENENIEIRTINNPFSEENLKKLDIQPINFQVNMKFE
ncbi:DUF3883 domain-containing protein [Enterococcus sp. DIV0187]|uniref:DUF3883 domain-containing protein n=1 Tax=Enterococcus sp. DIV0187 TaxID=2774644 RepID=UPI003F29491C